MDTSEDVSVALNEALQLYRSNDSVIFSFYKPVNPVSPSRSACGMVALTMAAQLLAADTFTTDAILEKAKNLHFTKRGEMFSAKNMMELARNLFPCQGTLIKNLCHNSTLLVNHVLDGSPLLIAYDAGKDCEPSYRRGQRAHWAVVSGICLVIPLNVLGDNYHESKIFHTNDGEFLKSLSHNARKILVYAHQSRRRDIAVWELDNLLSSNANLFEVDEREDLATLVLPEGDLLGELRDHAVLLKPI